MNKDIDTKLARILQKRNVWANYSSCLRQVRAVLMSTDLTPKQVRAMIEAGDLDPPKAGQCAS